MGLIKPEVYAPLVREKFEGKIKVGKMAVNLGYLSNTTVGETVTFPKWKLLSDATDVVKGVCNWNGSIRSGFQYSNYKNGSTKGNSDL